MDIKRREFLKITSMLGAGMFGPLNLNDADPYNVWKPVPPERLDKSETVCPLCPSFCRMEVLKKRELIFGLYPKTGYGLCPKGISYHNILYNESRIKTPLIRSGEKGSLSFRAIDYDSAFKIISEKCGKGGFHTDAFAPGAIERFYLGAVSNRINFHPDARLKDVCNADRVYFDVRNADLILNFGGDLLKAGEFIEKAGAISDKGKNIITFSPMVTNGTALGETWLPVRNDAYSFVSAGILKALGKNARYGFDEIEKATGLNQEIFAGIAQRIKSVKKICVSFSQDMLEWEGGADSLKDILLLAKELNVVNKEGGTYFFNEITSSKPFDIFRETVAGYFAYNIEPSLIYPVKEWNEKLKALPFVVYMGHHHSDISLHADIILPAPFYVERSEFYLKRDSGGYKLIKSGIAVEGGVEAVELRKKENIELIFQKILNLKAPYGIKDIDEIAGKINPKLPNKQTYLTQIDKSARISASMPVLKESASMAKKSGISLYLYQDTVLDFTNRGSKWAEEMSRDNFILVNSATAEKLKLKKGSSVSFKTESGEIKGKIFIYEGIANDTVGLKRFRKKIQGNAYAKGDKKFKSKDKEVALIWWESGDKELEKLLSYRKTSYSMPALGVDKLEVVKG
jgi:hypothetical protein